MAMTTEEFTSGHWMPVSEAMHEQDGIDMPNAPVPIFAYDEKTKRIYNIKGMSVEEVNGANQVYINIEAVQ